MLKEPAHSVQADLRSAGASRVVSLSRVGYTSSKLWIPWQAG